MKLQTKLSLGIATLFVIILLFGVLGIVSINRLSSQSGNILKNNYETLVYCNNMLKALDELPYNKTSLAEFETNLKKQEKNITEPGEAIATATLRNNFGELQMAPTDSSNYREIRQGLQQINNINQTAILLKNEATQKTAQTATFWLTLIFSILTIVALTLTINFPSVIATPLKALSEGIQAIALKDYSKRIYLKQQDELGELANAFNAMAEKLDAYEHSNLARIKFEKSRIETIINQMKDGIIGLDEQQQVLFVNVVAEKILGVKEAAIFGKYAPDIAIHNDLMRTLLQDQPNKPLKIFADEKESFFNRDVIDVSNNGDIIGKVIVLRNITPYHELNEAKTNFIATVSHELKTPISAIRLSLQLLENQQTGLLNTEQQALLNSIKDDTQRLLNITGELLDMTQAESGKINLHLKAANTQQMVNNAIEATHSAAAQKDILLVNQLPPDLPSLLADEEKITWVLVNLLSNAIRYSYEHSSVSVSAKAHAQQVILTVKDSGQGIAPAYQDKIFDRYFRVPGSSKEGTGLGLAICKEFIEAMNGTITAESEFGTGSAFHVTLPIASSV